MKTRLCVVFDVSADKQLIREIVRVIFEIGLMMKIMTLSALSAHHS